MDWLKVKCEKGQGDDIPPSCQVVGTSDFTFIRHNNQGKLKTEYRISNISTFILSRTPYQRYVTVLPTESNVNKGLLFIEAATRLFQSMSVGLGDAMSPHVNTISTTNNKSIDIPV